MRTPDDEGRRGSSDLRAARRTARRLDDDGLLEAMRAADPWAWLEFDQRFRPLLERFAIHTDIPVADWPACIDEVLADVAVKLTARSIERPRSLPSYLVRAARNARMQLERKAAARARRYGAAAETVGGERVVRALTSEYALRASAGTFARADDDPYATVATRLADALTRDLAHDDLAILGWAAECVPHRTIAEWIGASYEATTKRIWRLCQRLRRRAREVVATWPDVEERAAVARMIGIVAPPAAREAATDHRVTRSGGAER